MTFDAGLNDGRLRDRGEAGCSASALPAPNLGRLTVDDRVAFLLDWLVSVLAADSGVVFARTETGALACAAAIGRAGSTLPPDAGDPAPGLMVHVRHDDDSASPDACGHWLADTAAQMALSLPLEIEGRGLGLVQVGFDRPRQLRDDEARRAGVIVDHIAAALEAARLSRESAERLAEMERISTVLNEVDRLKGDFLSMVSHELRTPLTAIIGYTDLILRQVHGDLNERQHRYQTAVRRAAHRLLSLINDLLDLNRLESGHVTLNLEPVAIADAIQRAVSDVQGAAGLRGISVQVEMPRTTPTVRADRDRLNQVLVNLLDNAIKFTPEGGEISVEVRRHDGRATIAVLDAGAGIPAEQLERIWDRFHQADSSTRRQFGGTGLGLAIVRYIVEMHGGAVRAASGGPGLGSCFEIDLPIARTAASAAPVADGPSAVAPDDARRKRILVVDDEPDNREVITSILHDLLGYAVITARSGREALDRVRLNPDLILLDIRMPDLDGLEVTRRIKSNPGTASIPVLALTALSDEDDRRDALDAGCVGCITKPFNNEELASAIAHALEGAPEGARA